ncbi:uroporphyrinogen-III synthase [Pelagibius marinus]|uniref:uroporphyrinogen-III synthase n=1 Tax=Pelagibius marinus TaxID=2762760 RepID=UPI0018732417|nr:uroporphyrinogen-III synthase [Pelagibius marinus]
MRVLVTRPREDAASLAAALEARGHEALLEPLLTITPRDTVDWPQCHAAAQALLVTSANGARAFARLDARRDIPVFAVGDASATACRELGFGRVTSAAGDVGDLAALVAEKLDPAAGPLLHPAAGKPAGDLQGALAAAGFTVLRAVLYDARPAAALSAACTSSLNDGLIDVVTFFSPRTAAAFVSLVEAADLSHTCRAVTALCLSEAVAARISGLSWSRTVVAERPEQDALLAALDTLAGDRASQV